MAYTPQHPPQSPNHIPQFLFEELRRIATEMSTAQEMLRLGETFVAPTKPRAGDIRFADGTSWNPGAGRGFYGYTGTAWTKF